MSTGRRAAMLARLADFGNEIERAKQLGTKKPQKLADGAHKGLQDLGDKVVNHLPFGASISAILDSLLHSDSTDDRKLLLEQILTLLAGLEEGSLSRTLKVKIVELFYNDLAHPPSTYVDAGHAWRSADGSGNNPDLPDLGKAGAPYSRSVQQTRSLPNNKLPDPGLLFDTLLRRDEFRPHPGGLSSLMFNFAPLVVHTIFRTSHENDSINETSSYLDLAPLYGNNQREQDKIRIRDGTGKIYPDSFCEDRLLILPPPVCALLVLFNRNHNYIADKLLAINECGKWRHPSAYYENLKPENVAAESQRLVEQEEEIFQTARLINCGWFGMVLFSDYFATILGLVRYGSNWSLTPFDEIRAEDHSLFERGKGNSCSVEFNVLYRWHATISPQDEQYTESLWTHLFGNVPPESMTVEKFKQVAKTAMNKIDLNTEWTFGGLQRQEDGSFRDEDLAHLLQNATEAKAAEFGARGTPAVMRLNEIIGIEQSRAWNVCTLNDFRRFLHLKPYTTFEEWNPNPEVWEPAERLYGHIENLELYVGLQAEESKPPVPGAGLCPGYTISRAILSDGFALTRGDRFFTHDLTPGNLTAWGYADCIRDPYAYGFGSMLGKLLLRALPNHYSEDSVFTFFPFMTPEAMKGNLSNLGLLQQYDLNRPKFITPPVHVHDHKTVTTILSDIQNFSKPYLQRVRRVISGRGFFPAEGVTELKVLASVLSTPALVNQIGQYFYGQTRALVEYYSYPIIRGQQSAVDVTRDVFRNAVVHWVATGLAGIQLQTKTTSGPYTPGELFQALSEIYRFIFLDVEPSKVMVLETKVKEHIAKLSGLIKRNLNQVSVAGIVDSLAALSRPKNQEHREIVERFQKLGLSGEELTNTILALMVTSSVELFIATTNAFNLYLDTEHEGGLVQVSKAGDRDTLSGYVYEALRVDGPFRGVFRISNRSQVINGKAVNKGDRVLLDLGQANSDPSVFPNPNVVDVRRGHHNILFDDGVFAHIGEALTVKIVTETLCAVFSLEGVHRGPGKSGTLHRFKDSNRPELSHAYLDDAQLISEAPGSMIVLYTPVKK